MERIEMTANLTAVYQQYQQAEEEAQRIKHEMDAAYQLGNAAGKQREAELHPAWLAALKRAKERLDCYLALRDSTFTPGISSSRILTRAQFEALDPAARMTFIKAGGHLID
jgi:hypothetical protein